MEYALELPKEHCDHCVAREIVEIALLEEDICFIDEHDGLPRACERKDLRECSVQRLCGSPKVSRADCI